MTAIMRMSNESLNRHLPSTSGVSPLKERLGERRGVSPLIDLRGDNT